MLIKVKCRQCGKITWLADDLDATLVKSKLCHACYNFRYNLRIRDAPMLFFVIIGFCIGSFLTWCFDKLLEIYNHFSKKDSGTLA